MTILQHRAWQGAAVVAVLQTVILGSMVWDRVHLLKTGREITLETVPVDPRSLFRGDYVRLAYDISRIDSAILKHLPARDGAKSNETLPQNEVFYVTLRRDASGRWQATSASDRYPSKTEPEEIVLKGRYAQTWAANLVNVRYGIESYFVPEGSGKEIEDLARGRERRLSVVVSVDGRGNAAIKRLMLDGKVLREETPL